MSAAKSTVQGTSLVVQWLGLWASNARVLGSIPDRGTKMPHAAEQLNLGAATTEPVPSGVPPPQQNDPVCHN